jgi:hypothetical protein
MCGYEWPVVPDNPNPSEEVERALEAAEAIICITEHAGGFIKELERRADPGVTVLSPFTKSPCTIDLGGGIHATLLAF